MFSNYGNLQICPKCKNKVERLLALSRVDNKTLICNECGTKEALDAAGLIEGSSIKEAILETVIHMEARYGRCK